MKQMENQGPRVSIIIPAYQAEKTIIRAIDSVLSQDFSSYEIIIVDNNSSDLTGVLVKSKQELDTRIRYIYSNENLGPGGGRNLGINNSSGEYIAFLDADDEWIDTTKLSLQVKLLDEYHQFDLILTNCIVVDEVKEIKTLYSDINKFFSRGLSLERIYSVGSTYVVGGDLARSIYQGNFICISTVVVRKESLRAVSNFDEQLWGTEDIDIWVRLAKHSKFCYLDIVTTNYYWQESSISRLSEKRIKNLIKYHKSRIDHVEYKGMEDLIGTNLLYSYKLLILEYARLWKPIQALRTYQEYRKLGLRNNFLLLYAVSAFLGPIPIWIYAALIAPIRRLLIL